MEQLNIDWDRIEESWRMATIDQQRHLVDQWIEFYGPLPRLLRKRSMVHWGDEDHDRALADIQSVLATSAQSEREVADHFLCGLYLLDLADFAAAEQHFRAAIALGDRRGDPWHDGAAKLLLAVALLRQGRLGEARDIARALPEESMHWGGGQVWSRFDVLNYRPGV